MHAKGVYPESMYVVTNVKPHQTKRTAYAGNKPCRTARTQPKRGSSTAVEWIPEENKDVRTQNVPAKRTAMSEGRGGNRRVWTGRSVERWYRTNQCAQRMDCHQGNAVPPKAPRITREGQRGAEAREERCKQASSRRNNARKPFLPVKEEPRERRARRRNCHAASQLMREGSKTMLWTVDAESRHTRRYGVVMSLHERRCNEKGMP